MKLSKKFKVKIKSRVLILLLIVTVLSSTLAIDKIANEQESMIGQMESYMDGEEVTEIASVYDSSLTSEDRLENTDTTTYIYDANDLVAFRDSVNSGNDYAGKTVYVMADIDMSSVCSETVGSWVPIGTAETNFAGTFNGNYHIIDNLYINSSDYSWQGLFYSTAKNGTIQNIVMKNVSILNTYENISHGARTGGIAGSNYGKILNCGIENGNIVARRTMANTVVNTWPNAYTGGIAGLNGNIGTISGCYNKAKIESYAPQKNYNEIYAGGIVGINLHNIENCYNTGYITGNSYNEVIGGIVGGAELTSEKTGYVKNCYNYGTIASGTGTYKYAGGVVGRSGWCSTNYNLPVTNCFTTNNIAYSYYYWNGSGLSTSTAGKVTSDTLKTYTTTLGYAFSEDSININNGYPVLKWELPRYRIVENQEYVKIGENLSLTLQRIMMREGFEDNTEDIRWTSSNEDVAIVDPNGMITGKEIGHTTITAYNPTNGLKAKAIINVYRNQEGAITVPQVEIGEGFTIALKEDGTVWATGKNDVGQLGDGTTTNRNTLAQVKIDENTYLTNVRKIASSVQGSIALTQDGEVYAWGRNNLGQLGQGNTNDLLYATKVKGRNGLNYIQNVTDIAFRDYESYLLDKDGDVYGIGYNKFAQIDDDMNTNKTYPTLVEGFEEIIQITSGYSNVATLASNGEAWIRGNNAHGVFGVTTTSSTGGLYRIETDINEVRLAGYSGAILKEDGSLWTAGRNDVGQLGLGDTTDRSIYTQVNYENGEAVKPKTISVGSKNLQFIGQDGKVYVAGHNEKGQLSNGTIANVNYPIAMKNADGTEVTDCILLASGINTYYENQPKNMGIIKQDGSVWIVGDNTYGQIGNGTNESPSYLTKMGGEDTFHYQDNEIELYANETYQIDTQKFSYENNAFNVFKKEDYEVGNDLTYTSLDDNVANVNDNGEIIAKEVTGSTKIKIEDTTNGFTTYITVNVKNRLQNTDTTTYIYDANDLVAFRDSVNSGNDYAGKTVYVMADIDMSSVCSETIGSWVPIGNTTSNFTGNFDGSGKTISGLYINNSSNYQGLFGLLGQTGVIKNLTVKGSISTRAHSGAIVGWNKGKIEMCTNYVTMKHSAENWMLGGITGYNTGNVKRCINYGSISGYDSVGGIVGVNNGRIEECINKASVTNSYYSAGGIVGVNGYFTSWSSSQYHGKGYIYNCYNTGIISGKEAVGGIVGSHGYNQSNAQSYIYNSYTINTTTIVGYSIYGTAKNCYTTNVDLKTYATKLGYAFEDDTIDMNNGYPVLKWELPRYKIVENQEYIKIEQNLQLTLEEIMFREGFEDSLDNAEWTSSNTEVATVNSNGMVTGKGIGNTTITFYNPNNGLKTRAIINVYRNKDGAITIPQIVEQEGSTIVLKEDGTVWTAGLNDKGQLGDGTTTNRNKPVQVKIDEDTYLTNVVKLTAGSTEGTVALTKNGEVYGWGNNTYGNLATNNTQRQLYAHKMEINSNEKIIDVSSSDALTHVLTETGRVYYVGTCIFDGNNLNNGNETSYVLKEMMELEDTIKLESYSSWYGTYTAMQSNASTIGWGYDRWGQLGQGSTADTRNLTLIGTDIVDVEIGEYASIIQREDGDFYITGNNLRGGLGIGSPNNINTFQKISLPNDESGNIRKIVKAQRQGFNTVVLASDGTVWASGSNAVGQLSQGNTTDTNTFVPLKNGETEYLENAIDISSGEVLGDAVFRNTNIGVIKEDGSVWIAGDNTYGQIGNGINESSNYLTKMGGNDTFHYQDNEIELDTNETYQIDTQKLSYENNAFNVFKKEDYEVGDDLTYISLNENIATVNDNGQIIAKGETGSTKIKIEDTTNGLTTYITVKIKNRLQNTDTTTYIYDANDLVAFRDSVNSGNDYAGKTVYVMADIDMSSVCSETVGSWMPIGTLETNFAGTFNGNYHTISNLYLHSNEYRISGLFRTIGNTAIVENIVMDHIDLASTYDDIDQSNQVGGIAGGCLGTIKNCGIQSGSISNKKVLVYAKNDSLYPTSYAGGITAYLSGGTIKNCYNKAIITAEAPTTRKSTTCVNQATAGGIAGGNYGKIENCYNIGKIKSIGYNSYVGGIAGGGIYTSFESIKNVYNKGSLEISGTNKYSGGIMGRNGYNSTHKAMTISNSYTTNDSTYSYYYWNGSKVTTSTAGKIEPETLKTYATTLGYAFNDDSININQGYPILKWELPRYQIVENQEYVKIGESRQLTLERIMFREGYEDDLNDIQWTSSNTDVATIDSNGVVTGKGIGHTTITAYNSTNGLKAKAIINVYRNQEGAITVPQVEIGDGFTVVLKEDGTVWATGKNDVGQLGDGTTTNRNTLAQVKIDENTYLSNIKKIASSNSHTIALTVDGEVYAWGENRNGRLGQGDTTNRVYATKVKGPSGVGDIQDIIDIATGDRMSYVLNKDGIIYGAGYDVYGQITDTTSDKLYLTEVTEIEEAVQIKSGYCNLGAITSNAEVWVKGWNEKGTHGNGTTARTGGIYLVGTDIDEIKLSDSAHGVILKEDKTIWVTGQNGVGQLGLGDTQDRATYTQMKFENGDAVKAKTISAGGANIQLLGEDGKVYVTGYNAKGQLSNGTTANTSYPIAMKNADETEVSDVIALIVARPNNNNSELSKNMGIIKQDGSVWISGDNSYGQMGNGTNESTNYLTQMGGEDAFHYQDNEIDLYANETYQIDTQKLSYENNAFNVFKTKNYEVGDNLRYTSLDENIAIVNNSGEITAKGETGSTKVKIEDIANGFTTYITVNVKNRLQNTDTTTYIYDANDLVAFRDSVNSGNDYAGKTVYVMADIDMSSVCSETIGSFTPIGATGTNFAGTFNGNYHIINNLYINSNAYANIGLFSATAKTAFIRNLMMENIYISNTYDVSTAYTNTGGIVGVSNGMIQNCGINSGSIINKKTTAYTGSSSYPSARAGGIVGQLGATGIVQNCYNRGTITANAPTSSKRNEQMAAGIVAVSYGRVENCYNMGKIIGTAYNSYVGGVIGIAGSNSEYARNLYNAGITEIAGTTKLNAGVIARNGWSEYPTPIPVTNCFTSDNVAISYNYWSGSSYKTSTQGRTKAETLKTYATTLGSAYKNDTININNGYPILTWELPQYKILENQSYIKVGDSFPLTLEKNRFREGYEHNSEDIEWTSSNEDVATINNNGVVTGKAIGHTTITAYNSKIGIKAKAIINVYRNQEGAITVPQVEIGEGYTVILKEDGTVWTTGKNDVGQLGDGTTTNRNTLVQVKTAEDTYLTNVRKISTGFYHTVALTTEGEVFVWGDNHFGQLGQGDTTNRSYATKMKGMNGQGNIENIIDIVAGDYSTYLLMNTGETYGVGYNKWEQIENNTTDTSYPKIATGFDEAIAVTAGYSNGGVIKSNGEVWVRGNNPYGVFGNNTTAAIGGLHLIESDINEFRLEGQFGSMLKEDGSIWTAGRNDIGQLGVGDTTSRTVYTQVKFKDGSPVKAKTITGGSQNLQFIGQDGKVYVTGYNAKGQLSDGTTTNATHPTMMKNQDTTEVTDIILLAQGGNCEYARQSLNMGVIKQDGTVWLSGDNTYGQIGNRNNESSSYLAKMGDAFLKYPEETITLNVGGYKKIDKLLFERQDEFNVFVKEATIQGDLTYEVEDEEIASITNLGMIEGRKQGITRVKVTDSNTKASTYIEIEVMDVNLKSVTVNDIDLQPEETDKSTYKMNIKKLDTKAKVKIVTEYPEATIIIGGHEKEIGESEQWVDLSLEEDVIEIPVIVSLKSEETTSTVMYKIVLTRQSNDTNAVVSYDGTELTKAEDGKYKVNVLDTVTSGEIEVVTTHEKAKVDIGNTEQYQQGSKEYTVSINADSTNKTIEVPITIMAEDGTVENSIVVITIIATNANTAKIEGTFEVEGKEITKQATIDEEGNYLIGVKETTKEIELKITTESQYATIARGTELGKGELITKVTLEDDITYVDYEVTAEDGKTKAQKTIKIVKQSSDANVKSIVVEGKEIVADDEGIYHASVEGGSTGAKVIITANSNVATVGISGIANPNTNKAILNTTVGINTIQNTYTITITAEDGTVKIYTLKITRQTNIAGKIITENVEGKHKSFVTVYKANDKRPETKPLNDETTEIREVIASQETKEDGTFIIEVDDIELYDVLVTKAGYLDYRVTDIEVEKGAKTELTEYKLMAGDVVKSGQIEIDDLVALNDNFGVVITDANREQKAIYDLNEDGKVDDLDREILRKNYGKKNKLEQWEDPKRIRRMRTRRVETLPENPQNFILPIKGKYQITSDYGTRIHPVTGEVKKHTGIDLGGEHRTEIYAVADGEVVFAGVQNAFGNCIEIKHEIDGEIIYSFYAHLSRIDVKVGQEIKQEEVIGLEGGDPNTDPNPGSSTGHHLHFELRSKSGYGNDVNPRDYIEF